MSADSEENLIDVTVHLHDLEPIEFCSPIDHEVLTMLCRELGSPNVEIEKILHLSVMSDDGPTNLYIPKSALKAIETSDPLPAEHFQPVSTRAELTGEEHFPADWINWVHHNLEIKADKDSMHDTMVSSGFPSERVCDLLQHTPTRPFLVQNHPDKEQITPKTDLTTKGLTPYESEYVEMYTCSQFLTAAECKEIEALTVDKFTRSRVVGVDGADQRRTSHSATLIADFDDMNLAARIQQRISEIVDLDLAHLEQLQSQRYETAEFYQPHYDYFSNEFPTYQDPRGVVRKGQRLWSCIVYLRDAEKCSGTQFNRLNIEMTPNQGDMFIWRNLYPTGKPNPYTMHQGLPVGEKTKFILTQWVRTDLETVSAD
ncbi:MAG: 2OG-Fe(II) oxygenase [Pseudomonadota bacterium]